MGSAPKIFNSCGLLVFIGYYQRFSITWFILFAVILFEIVLLAALIGLMFIVVIGIFKRYIFKIV